MGAMILDVLHEASGLSIVGLKDAVVHAVEGQHVDAELLAELSVEGRRRGDPATLQVELGVAVVHEEVGTKLLFEARGPDVVAYVGEMQARRDATGSSSGREEQGLPERAIDRVVGPGA